jgi:hypothetical protein
MHRYAIYLARFRGFAALRKCMETGGLDMLDLSNGESAR